MDWRELTSLEQLDELIEGSHQYPVAIYKHSTCCLISATAKKRLEKQWDVDGGEVIPYYLDSLKYKEIGKALQDKYGISHHTPQILVIKNGKAVYNASYLSISVKKLAAAV